MLLPAPGTVLRTQLETRVYLHVWELEPEHHGAAAQPRGLWKPPFTCKEQDKLPGFELKFLTTLKRTGAHITPLLPLSSSK